MSSNDFAKKKEATRKLIGAALCDLIAYIGSSKESFVVGGQYPNDKLIKVFREWLNSRRFDISEATDLTEVWLNASKQGTFCPKEGLPPASPKAPKKPRKPLVRPPDEASEPDEGYFKEDAWKPEEDRKDNWTDEGEDWKDGNDLQTS